LYYINTAGKENSGMDMENYKLVLPGHLNHYGYLFGGNLLQWVDEVGWIAASMDYPGCNFVTIGMDKVEFKKSVRQGALLRFETKQTREGDTSVRYTVDVYRHDMKSGAEEPIFSTSTTFVCIDSQGEKCGLHK
jgi:acyl-CoA hydrolase